MARARERREADARRLAAMFWMPGEADASYAEVARATGLSISRVQQVCQGYGYLPHRRSEYTARARSTSWRASAARARS